jgi:hypothetical protein
VAGSDPRHTLCSAGTKEHRGSRKGIWYLDTYKWDVEPSGECKLTDYHANNVSSADMQELEDPFYITANKMFGTCHSSSASTTKVM